VLIVFLHKFERNIKSRPWHCYGFSFISFLPCVFSDKSKRWK